MGMDSSLGVPPVWGLWRDVAPQVLTTLPHTAALLPFAPLGPRLSGAWDSGGTAVFWAHGSLGPGAFWGPWLFEAHGSLLPAFFWAAWGLWGTAAFWGPWSFSAWVFWGAPSSLGPVAFGAQSFTGPIALWGCIPLRRPHSSAGVPPCHGSGEISAVRRSSDRSPGPGCAHRSTKGSPGPGGGWAVCRWCFCLPIKAQRSAGNGVWLRLEERAEGCDGRGMSRFVEARGGISRQKGRGAGQAAPTRIQHGGRAQAPTPLPVSRRW